MKTIFLAFILLSSLNGFAQKKVGAPANNPQMVNAIIGGSNTFYKVCIAVSRSGDPYTMDFLNCADPNKNDGKVEFNIRDQNLNFLNKLRAGGWMLTSTFTFNNAIHYLFLK